MIYLHLCDIKFALTLRTGYGALGSPVLAQADIGEGIVSPSFMPSLMPFNFHSPARGSLLLVTSIGIDSCIYY